MNDQIKGEMTSASKILSENIKGSSHVGDPGVYISEDDIKMDLRQQYMSVWTGFIQLRLETKRNGQVSQKAGNFF
jgi:hypothetical protein